MADLVDSMLDLMRRLPPTRTEENVAALIGICPDYADDLLGSVDQPLQLRTDRATGRDYLACDYNRDGESYRYNSNSFQVHVIPAAQMVLIDLRWSDPHGRMNTILRWMMGRFRHRNSGSWKLRQMKHLILIAKCMLFPANRL